MELPRPDPVAPVRARDQQRVDRALEPRAQGPAETPWGPARKAAFRFAFSYLALYLFPLSTSLSATFGRFWADSKLVAMYEGLWHKIAPWVGAHILHLTRPITIVGESADSTYENVKVLCFATIAALATVVWSVIDQKRIAYSKLDQWLRLYVRLVVACAMFIYGAGKVIPAQMLPPNLSTLM